MLLVLGTLAGPQFAAAVELPLEAAGFDFTTTADERWLGFASAGGLLAGSVLVGIGWRRREWLIAAACFYVPYTLLFTAFFTDVSGFGSGMWESLDYWLGQQKCSAEDSPNSTT